MFLWVLYVGGKDIDEVWSPTDLVNGHKRRPEYRNILGGALNSQQMAHMSHHRPPHMPERCGIRPKAPSMVHPAQRLMPNGPVGRKLQRFEGISRASAYAHMRGRGRV
jgi:hypothetical protein